MHSFRSPNSEQLLNLFMIKWLLSNQEMKKKRYKHQILNYEIKFNFHILFITPYTHVHKIANGFVRVCAFHNIITISYLTQRIPSNNTNGDFFFNKKFLPIYAFIHLLIADARLLTYLDITFFMIFRLIISLSHEYSIYDRKHAYNSQET